MDAAVTCCGHLLLQGVDAYGHTASSEAASLTVLSGKPPPVFGSLSSEGSSGPCVPSPGIPWENVGILFLCPYCIVSLMTRTEGEAVARLT